MDFEDLLNKYNEAMKYISILEDEISRLKAELGYKINDDIIEYDEVEESNQSLMKVRENNSNYDVVNASSTNEDKVALFVSLF